MDSGRWRAPAAHGPVRATLRLPGSKSITNRALILAALSDSPSVVRGVLKARDSSLAIGALRALGCAVTEHGTDVGIHPGSPAQGAAVSIDELCVKYGIDPVRTLRHGDSSILSK